MPETQNPNIEYDPEKASRGGLSAILEFQGILVSHERIPNKFGETRTKFGTATEDNPEGVKEAAPDQIQVNYEEVVILRMEEGVEEPELTDSKFNLLINYAKPGQAKSHSLSQWNRGYADSCKEVYDKLPNEVVGQLVRMGKREVTMKIRDNVTKEDKEIIAVRWCFIPMDDDPGDLDAYARGKIEGKNKSAALRAVMQDGRLKTNPEYRDAVAAGKPVAGMEIIEGIYVTSEGS